MLSYTSERQESDLDVSGFIWTVLCVLAVWLVVGMVFKVSLQPYPEFSGVVSGLVDPVVVLAFTGLALYLASGWRSAYLARKRALSDLAEADECIEQQQRRMSAHVARNRKRRLRRIARRHGGLARSQGDSSAHAGLDHEVESPLPPKLVQP